MDASESGPRLVPAGAPIGAREASLLEHVATPITITAMADGAVLFANSAACRLFEVAGACVQENVRSPSFYADPAARATLVKTVQERGEVINHEIEFVTRAGRRFWGLLSGNRVTFDGTPAIMVSIMDFSAQKARELQFAQLTGQLRAQAAESQLLNRELKRQQQLAIIANRAKSDFLARMSHELRSPLNAILGFSEVIADDLLGAAGTPRYQDYAQSIHDAGAHLLALINDILDLSKVEAGKVELNIESVDLNDLVRSSLELMAPQAERRGVLLQAEYGVDHLALDGDRLRLRQIFLNLLSNAIKFTLAGGTVRVAVRQEGEEVVIETADSGIGMSPEQLEVALQPFGQVMTESPYAQVGTGLGLPIVVSLVELHGGTFEIDSTPNVGTRVTVRLPRRR